MPVYPDKTTIILPLSRFPEDTRVRKKTGSAFFIVKNEIKIGGPDPQKIFSKGVRYLVSDRGYIEAVRDDERFAIDFPSILEAIEFMQEIIDVEDQESGK